MGRILAAVGRVLRGLTGRASSLEMTEEDWLTTLDAERMLRFVNDSSSHRKLRLFCITCCRRVWEMLEDERSRQAVEVAERHADGLAKPGELAAARAAAQKAHRRFPAESPAGLAALVVVHSTAPDEGLHGSRRNRSSAAQEEDPGWLAARAAQSASLRDLFGNPFRPAVIPPDCLTPSVVSVAQATYEDRALPSGHLDLVRLSVLADALEEAGCHDLEVLGHLRSPGPHTRGCFILDLILSKDC